MPTSGQASEAKERTRRGEGDFLRYADAEGHKLDFHALRHTTGTWLAEAGVQPRRIERLMRHSTITLTMATYGHLFPGDEADTVSRFPPVDPGETHVEGSTGAGYPPRDHQQIRQQSRHDSVRQRATACDPIPRPDGHESAGRVGGKSLCEATVTVRAIKATLSSAKQGHLLGSERGRSHAHLGSSRLSPQPRRPP